MTVRSRGVFGELVDADNPRDVLKLFANRGQALVSCTVAIATAMRIVASVRDGPEVQRWRSLPPTSIDHQSDLPLYHVLTQ